MSKVVVEKIDGQEMAKATVTFDLGKVSRSEVSIDGEVISVVSGMDIDGMERFFKRLAFDKGVDENWEEFEDTLNQYINIKLMQIVGVKQSPLQFDTKGNLEGLDESVEVEIID